MSMPHAFVANKLGDGTAKWSGRMTLNPMKHIDPIGALMIVLFGVGWAKPVPINPRNFKNYKRDTALTAAAGPISNVIMAFIYLIVENAIFYISIASGAVIRTGSFIFVLCLFFTLAAQINLSLAVFNLLPIPPLDGSRLFGALLPGRSARLFAIRKCDSDSFNLRTAVWSTERSDRLFVKLFIPGTELCSFAAVQIVV